MIVRVKLMGMLKEKSPPAGQLELPEGATIGTVLEQLGIDRTSVQAFSVNGSIELKADRELQDNDELTALPPVGGG